MSTDITSLAYIAVVWDDTDITHMLIRYLGEYGYRVTASDAFDQGLELCVDNPPDLLITPRHFHDKPDGGLELCRQLRMMDELPRFPIIVGENEPWRVKQEDAFQQAFDAGANACFGRVWQTNDILEMIKILLADPSTTNLIDRQSAKLRHN